MERDDETAQHLNFVSNLFSEVARGDGIVAAVAELDFSAGVWNCKLDFRGAQILLLATAQFGLIVCKVEVSSQNYNNYLFLRLAK